MTFDDSDLLLRVELLPAEPPTMRFVVAGELDLAGAGRLSLALDSVPDHTAAVLDLSQVDFIDTSGLRVLLQCRSERRTVVERPSPAVVRLCDLAAVPQLLERPDGSDAHGGARAGSPV